MWWPNLWSLYKTMMHLSLCCQMTKFHLAAAAGVGQHRLVSRFRWNVRPTFRWGSWRGGSRRPSRLPPAAAWTSGRRLPSGTWRTFGLVERTKQFSIILRLQRSKNIYRERECPAYAAHAWLDKNQLFYSQKLYHFWKYNLFLCWQLSIFFIPKHWAGK